MLIIFVSLDGEEYLNNKSESEIMWRLQREEAVTYYNNLSLCSII